jgi:TPR repeat protein
MGDLPADSPAQREDGLNVAKEAVRLLRRLALTHGHPQSQYALGNFYIAGYPEKFHAGVEMEKVDSSLAHPSLEKAGQKPHYGKAMELWVMAAKRNHANATYYVALCTEKGLGVRASDRRAVKYYRKAASLNHPGAMTRLALALLRGELGLQPHQRDGVKWLKIATKYADTRFPQSCLELALLHSHGIEHVILRDDRHVVELLMQGSELGNAECQWRLGKIYETQRIDDDKTSPPVVVRDGKRALHWYHRAAAQGHAPSILEIARWYMTGWKKEFELSKNPELAFKWAVLAADKQFPRGMFVSV